MPTRKPEHKLDCEPDETGAPAIQHGAARPDAPDNHTRLGPQDRFWLVTDATPLSVLADVLCETTLAGLHRQFLGGLSMDDEPTLFLDYEDAVAEARRRLVAVGVRAAGNSTG